MDEIIPEVDRLDREIGSGPRGLIRKQGKVHRIIRLFLFNSRGEILLQMRSDQVRDMAGRLDQSAGGHVDPGEDYLEALKRETEEELGVKLVEEDIKLIAKYYREESRPNGDLFKRYNALYSVVSDQELRPDPSEVQELVWADPDELNEDMKKNPDSYAPGFIIAFNLYRLLESKL